MLGGPYLDYIAFLDTFDQLKPVPFCSLGWRKVPASSWSLSADRSAGPVQNQPAPASASRVTRPNFFGLPAAADVLPLVPDIAAVRLRSAQSASQVAAQTS